MPLSPVSHAYQIETRHFVEKTCHCTSLQDDRLQARCYLEASRRTALFCLLAGPLGRNEVHRVLCAVSDDVQREASGCAR